MAWQFKQKQWKVFQRNPLDTVVAQLRFQPILRISTGDAIPDFQECLRNRFPGFGEGELRSLTIGPDAKVSSKSEKSFLFLRDEDQCSVQLAADNIIVESKKHRSREVLLEDLCIAVNALTKIFSPIKATRFGVRYINIINTKKISSDLDRTVTLESTVASEYLSIPASVANLEDTVFSNQISSPMESGGLTLRYGIPPHEKGESSIFQFDIDRFIDSEIDLKNIGELLTNFTGDIFSLFMTLPGNDLSEWMAGSVNN